MILVSMVLVVGALAIENPRSFQAQVVSATASEFKFIEWYQFLGGMGSSASEVIQTSDGGYAVIGTYEYPGTGGLRLFKIDSFGNIQWNQNYSKIESMGTTIHFSKVHSLKQTSNGGYSFLCEGRPEGSKDQVILIKTDSGGNVTQTFSFLGGGSSIVETNDGGFIMAGSAWTGEEIVSNIYHSFSDGLLVKADSYGRTEWSLTYGDQGHNIFSNVIQASDGGYAVAGVTSKFSPKEKINDLPLGLGDLDAWFLKIDSHGRIQWNITLGIGPGTGSPGYDAYSAGINEPSSIIQAIDGCFFVAGKTHSRSSELFPIDVPWIVKIDSSGKFEWGKTYGQKSNDYTFSEIINTRDGGLAVVGTKPYREAMTWQGGGPRVIWLVKTDFAGNLQWNQSLYSSSMLEGYDGNNLIETSDGGFVVAGAYNYGEQKARGYFYVAKTYPAGPNQNPSPTEHVVASIMPDGTVSPQNVPIKRNGSVYTLTNNFNGSIAIQKDNTVFDGGHFLLQGTNGIGEKTIIRPTEAGFYIVSRTNITIKNTIITHFIYGSYISNSTNIKISGNNITLNGQGILLTNKSSNNTISGNEIHTNAFQGVWLNDTIFSTVSKNTLGFNGVTGISISGGASNVIYGNTIGNDFEENKYCIGLYLRESRHNIIAGNNITKNLVVGIALDYGSSENIIYGNNFVNNDQGDARTGQISLYGGDFLFPHPWLQYGISNTSGFLFGLRNFWDNGTLGNYWSEYTLRNPNAAEIDNSGIWGTPYVIGGENNTDNYPLVALIGISNVSEPYPPSLPPPTAIPTPAPSAHTDSPLSQIDSKLIVLSTVMIAAVIAVIAVFAAEKRKKKRSRMPR